MRAQKVVALNIRKVRVRTGLSQEALAVDAGIDRTYVSRLERGLENPTVAILEKISREGEASLTAQERDTLEDASRRYQQRRQ